MANRICINAWRELARDFRSRLFGESRERSDGNQQRIRKNIDLVAFAESLRALIEPDTSERRKYFVGVAFFSTVLQDVHQLCYSAHVTLIAYVTLINQSNPNSCGWLRG